MNTSAFSNASNASRGAPGPANKLAVSLPTRSGSRMDDRRSSYLGVTVSVEQDRVEEKSEADMESGLRPITTSESREPSRMSSAFDEFPQL